MVPAAHLDTVPLPSQSYILVQNRQGKTRIAKWYISLEDAEKSKLKQDVHRLVASRDDKKQSNFVEV